jgi:hypothetical protein
MTRAAATARPATRSGNRRTAGKNIPAGPAATPADAGSGYLAASERPWASFVFLLPLVVWYELYASGWVGRGESAGPNRDTAHITAFLLIDQFFALLGAVGRHLPAFALAAMLLAAHVARRDRWSLKLETLAAMAVESVVWALPIVVLGWVMARYTPLADAPPTAGGDTGRAVALCVGAGVYEEMVFRLIGVTVLVLILKDVLRLPNRAALGMVLLASGVLFSLYHYLSPHEHFRLSTFGFRALAGGYFGLLFLLRGFGVTAGTHSAYDLIVVLFLPR